MTTGYERRWETRRGGGRSAADASRRSYYGLPVIHGPHWKWLIIVYFFLGGIAGASYAIATIAHLFGGKEEQRIVRAGRYLSFAALIPSVFCLIFDLGRPERFFHMLRVVKLRSPMSIGTWGLSTFGVFCTLSALIQAAQDGLFGRNTALARLLRGLPGGAIGAAGAVPAFFMSGYTGVLLAATAVPLWMRNYLLMGPLFVASALSNATAAIALILSLAGRTSHRTLAKLERLDSIALLAEAGLLLTSWTRLGRTVSRPLTTGHLAPINRYGVFGAGLGLPLLLQAPGAWLGRKSPRLVTVIASLLVLAGGFMFRYLIIMAGRASADDPDATFEITRLDGRQ